MTLNSKQKQTHIALIIKGLGLGGAERVVFQTAQFLLSRRYDITVINIAPRHSEMRTVFDAAGIRVKDIPVVGLLAPLRFVQLCAFLVRQKVDVIYAHLPIAGVVARLAAWATGHPVIYAEHCLVFSCNRTTFLLNKLTYGLNSVVIAVSDAVADSIRRDYNPPAALKIHTIPNGIDCERINSAIPEALLIRKKLGFNDGQFVFGTVAALRSVKRLDLLVEAFADLAQKYPEIRLLIVGGGEQLEALKHLADSLKVKHLVHFTGWQESSSPYLGALDTYVICSEHEGLPIALLEAMAMTKPVIATPVGGIPSLVFDHKNGLIAPTCDKNAVLMAMEEMFLNKELRQRLAENAYSTVVNDWNFKQTGLKIENIIESIVKDV